MVSNFKCRIPLSTTHFRDVITQWISAYYHSVQLPCVKTLQKFSKLIINNHPHPPTPRKPLIWQINAHLTCYIFFFIFPKPPLHVIPHQMTRTEIPCVIIILCDILLSQEQVSATCSVTNISGFDFTYSTVQNVSYSI